MKIFCDFDGVIVRHSGIPTQNKWFEDPPMEGAKESIELFIKNGHEVVVFTANDDREMVKKWLEYYEFPDLRVTNIKESATIYLDDRAIRFVNWNDFRKLIL